MSLFYRTTNVRNEFGTDATTGADSVRWCDAFGPYELAWDSEPRRGVGPFFMKVKRRTKIKNDSVMLICEFERRDGGCPAYAYVTHEGQLLGRHGLHNHLPLRDYPQCSSDRLNEQLSSISALPTFAEASALLRDPRRRRQWFRQTREAGVPLPATSMPIPDPDTGTMIETEITTANVLEISRYAEKRETINGEIRLACPVPGCKHVSKKGGIYKHLRMLHMSLPDRGTGDLTYCDEKLCPLCKEDKITHEDLIRHIVHDHDTRLECTEHEFESEEDFKKWKKRTEQEEMSSFTLRSTKNRAPQGTYVCCRSGRKHRRSPLSRLLGFECPASMVVERRNSRLCVWFWRTHIGHRPAVVDVTLSAEDRLWVKNCILNKMNNRDIILEGMSGYLGGNPRRVHLLDSQDIENIVRHFDLKDVRGDIKSKHFKKEDLRKVRLARYVKRTMGNDRPMEAALNRAYHNELQPKRSMAHDSVTGFYTVTGENEGDRGIVFPRRAGHRECDHVCDFCRVCIHRYGCTCLAFMSDGLMCDHIHTVAMLAGAPGDEWVHPTLRRETFGLDEALLRLARINYKERLEKMLPLLDEFVKMIKTDQHQIDLDKLQELLDSGIAMIRSCPKPPVTLDDEAPTDALASHKETDLFDFGDDELTLPTPRSTGSPLRLRPSASRVASSDTSAVSSPAATAGGGGPTAKADAKLARVAGVAMRTTPVSGAARALTNVPRLASHTRVGGASGGVSGGAQGPPVRPTYSRRAGRIFSPLRVARTPASSNLTSSCSGLKVSYSDVTKAPATLAAVSGSATSATTAATTTTTTTTGSATSVTSATAPPVGTATMREATTIAATTKPTATATTMTPTPTGMRIIQLPTPETISQVVPSVLGASPRSQPPSQHTTETPPVSASVASSPSITTVGGALSTPTRVMVPLPQLLAAGLRPGSVAIIRKGPPPPGAVLVRGPAPILLKAAQLPTLSGAIRSGAPTTESGQSSIADVRAEDENTTAVSRLELKTELNREPDVGAAVEHAPANNQVPVKSEPPTENQHEDNRSDRHISTAGGVHLPNVDRLLPETSRNSQLDCGDIRDDRQLSVKREACAELGEKLSEEKRSKREPASPNEAAGCCPSSSSTSCNIVWQVSVEAQPESNFVGDTGQTLERPHFSESIADPLTNKCSSTGLSQ